MDSRHQSKNEKLIESTFDEIQEQTFNLCQGEDFRIVYHSSVE